MVSKRGEDAAATRNCLCERGVDAVATETAGSCHAAVFEGGADAVVAAASAAAAATTTSGDRHDRRVDAADSTSSDSCCFGHAAADCC